MAAGGNWIPWDGNFFIKVLMKIDFYFVDIFFPVFRGFKLLVGPNMAFRRKTLEKINGFVSNDSCLTEDQLISFKMTKAKIKYDRFYDCDNFHSCRSWSQSIPAFFRYVYSSINPKYYPEKSN